MTTERRKRLFIAAALLIACAAAWPLVREAGLLNTRGGGDSPFLLQRLHQLETALRDGHFPVRWMPDANYGYGYPFFNYYAPLAFYVAVLFRFVGFGIVRSIQLSQLMAFLLAAGGMYGLAREWLKSEWGALLASAAYTLAPFHLVNVYVRGDSIAEFWAMGFYPLVIWGISRWPLAMDSWRELVRPGLWIVLAYAGLIISHNISALIFSPFILLYALIKLVQASQSNRPQTSHRPPTSRIPFIIHPSSFIIIFLLALALAAWFWLPALGEQSLTQLEGITADYFDYNRHFRAADLVQTGFFFDFGVQNLQAFRMGLLQAIIIVVGLAATIIYWYRLPTPNPHSLIPDLFLLFSLLLATFMITPLSKPLWDNLPLLPFTQFPWRFLSIQAFWGALAAGFVAVILPERVRPWLSIGLIGLLALSSLGRLQTDYLYLTDTDITAERLAQYEWFTGNIGTTISAEYLAPTMVPRPYTSAWLNQGERWRVNVVAGEAAAEPLVTKTQRQVWRVQSEGATLVLPLMVWDGWEAVLDGEVIALQAAEGSGLAQVVVPEGTHTLELHLSGTPIRQAAEWVSLGALLLVVGGWWISRPTLAAGDVPAPRPGRQRIILLFVVGLMLTLAVVLNQARQRPLAAETLTWDFGEMGYLHHAPQGVPYGNGALLAGHAISDLEVAAGETVDITLDWTTQPPGEVREVTVGLTSPAHFRYGGIQPLVSATRPLLEGEQTYSLRVPAAAPPGLYVPLVTLSDRNRPRTLSGVPRARELALPPVRVITAEGAREPAARPLEMAVDEVVLWQTEGGNRFMELDVVWWTAQALRSNYNVSVRLLTLEGLELYAAQFDLPPGHGYRPAVTWTAGAWTADRLTVPLPADENLPLPPPYVLLVQLYNPAALETPPALTRRVGYLDVAEGGLAFRPHEPQFARPEGIEPVEAVLVSDEGEPLLELVGYRLAREGEALEMTLYWQALGSLTADYTHFVHLLDAQTGQPAAQHDAMPQNNSYPTSQWVVGEVVADSFVLDVAGVPEGEYVLTAGMYEARPEETFPRLQIEGGGDTVFLRMVEH